MKDAGFWPPQHFISSEGCCMALSWAGSWLNMPIFAHSSMNKRKGEAVSDVLEVKSLWNIPGDASRPPLDLWGVFWVPGSDSNHHDSCNHCICVCLGDAVKRDEEVWTLSVFNTDEMESGEGDLWHWRSSERIWKQCLPKARRGKKFKKEEWWVRQNWNKKKSNWI